VKRGSVWVFVCAMQVVALATFLSGCASDDLKSDMVNSCDKMATDSVTANYVDLGASYATQSPTDPNKYLVTLVAQQPSVDPTFGYCIGVDEQNGNYSMRAATKIDLSAFGVSDSASTTPTASPSASDFSDDETTFIVTGRSRNVEIDLIGTTSSGSSVTKSLHLDHLPWRLSVSGDSPYAVGSVSAQSNDGQPVACKIFDVGGLSDSERSDPSTHMALCIDGANLYGSSN
jgi:hypothetical protein